MQHSSGSWGHNARERFEHNCGLIGSDERAALRASGLDRAARAGAAVSRLVEFRDDLFRASDDGMTGETDALLDEALGFLWEEAAGSIAALAGEAIRQFADCILACQRRLRTHADRLRQYTSLVVRELRELLNQATPLTGRTTGPWLRDPLAQRSIQTCEQILADRYDPPSLGDCQEDFQFHGQSWPHVVQLWEEFGGLKDIDPKPNHDIEERVLRQFAETISEKASADEHRLRSIAGALCIHYGSVILTSSVTPPEAEKISVIGDAGFWKEREEEFRKHDTDDTGYLEANWRSTDSEWQLKSRSEETSSFGGDRVFMALARQAAAGLAGPHRDDLCFRWLDALKQYGCGTDSLTSSGSISEARVNELRISDEIVPPHCHLVFTPGPLLSHQKPKGYAAELLEPNAFHAQFIKESTSYRIENIFETSANFCLELKSCSSHAKVNAADLGSAHGPQLFTMTPLDPDELASLMANATPDSERGAGNVVDAGYAQNNPAPILRCVRGSRLIAIANLRRAAKQAVERGQPKTAADADRCLQEAITAYARKLFDKRAKRGFQRCSRMKPKVFARWLNNKCLPAVVNDASGITGQFQITVRWIADGIANRTPRDTYHALWGILATEFEPDGFLHRLEKHLKRELEARSLHWDGKFRNQADALPRTLQLPDRLSRKGTDIGEWKATGLHVALETSEDADGHHGQPVGTESHTAITSDSLLTGPPESAGNPVLGSELATSRIGTARLASWEELRITVISDERVEIRCGARRETRNYHELGFVDRRTGKPNEQWAVLLVLAREKGFFPDSAKTGPQWEAIAKRIERTRKGLQRQFGLDDDPLPFVEGGYKARFVVDRAAAADK